jgi:hypothetical protein
VRAHERVLERPSWRLQRSLLSAETFLAKSGGPTLPLRRSRVMNVIDTVSRGKESTHMTTFKMVPFSASGAGKKPL